MHVCSQQRPEEGAGSSGTGVVDNYNESAGDRTRVYYHMTFEFGYYYIEILIFVFYLKRSLLIKDSFLFLKTFKYFKYI